MTYLHWLKGGRENVEWANRAVSKGAIWASPGPYLRQSTLLTVARKISDYMLPEAFYGHTTFDESEVPTSCTTDESETLALALAVRLKNEEDIRKQKEEEREYEDDDDEDDDYY